MLYSSFSQQLTTYIETNKTVSLNWVLALSGGLDSRVLLHLLARFKKQYSNFQYHAVYVNHGLSPHADDWAKACQYYCQQAEIEFSIEKVWVDRNSKNGLEQAAREARYHALAQYIDQNSVLLTAQHATDQMETFLLALKRGSGVAGLSAMPKQRPFAQGQLYRPLLAVSHSDIAQYAQQHALNWVEDESNQQIRFDRNFIRHQVTPVLTERWPHIESAIIRSANLCAEQESLLNELLQEKLKSLQSKDNGLSINGLKKQSHSARNALIRQWLRSQNLAMPSQQQLSTLWHQVALAQPDAKPQLCYGTVQIGRHQNNLYAFTLTQDISKTLLEWDIEQPLLLPDGLGELALLPVKTDEVNSDDLFICLPDSKKIMVVFSLEDFQTIKTDKIKPDNRQHSRSWKKLLQEYQVPVWQRRRIPLLIKNNQLVAASGLFVTQLYSCKSKNDDKTKINDSIYQLIWTRNGEIIRYGNL